MGIRLTKDQTVTFSLSTLAAVLVAVGTAYPVARTALADELKGLVKQEVQPLTNAFKVTTQASIRTLRTTISALNFKKDMCSGTPGCWTLSDQRDLDAALADLESAEEVLRNLQ